VATIFARRWAAESVKDKSANGIGITPENIQLDAKADQLAARLIVHGQ
jgi:hypothetical protein